jgi:Tol biopolymer transport system component
MNLRITRFWKAGCLTLSVIWFWTLPPAGAQSLQPVSALDPSLGPPSGAGCDSGAPILTPDGRYVLFASSAENLLIIGTNGPVPPRLNRPLNVYLRDRSAATTTLVSVDVTGRSGGNANSLPKGISTNGEWVLFESFASNLVPGDNNNASDIFVRDVVKGTTLLVSASTSGSVGNRTSKNAVFSHDGRYVAFASLASNLVPGDTNRLQDVFVRDLQTGTTTLASFGSVTSSVGYPSGNSDLPVITPDGRYVTFSSSSSRSPNRGLLDEIYRRDLVERSTIWVSADASNVVNSVFGFTNVNVTAFNHAMSDDGQVIYYEAAPDAGSTAVLLRYDAATGLTLTIHTNAANATLAAGALDMTPDGRKVAFMAYTGDNSGSNTFILVWDAETGTITLASESLINPVWESMDASAPALDQTGRYVAFLSSAEGLVTNALRSGNHLYVRDLQAGTTALADEDAAGVGSGVALGGFPSINPGGRVVAFNAPDGTLVPGDQNGFYDVFVRDLVSRTNELISAATAGLESLTVNGLSTLSPGCVSSDGRFVAFRSAATDLVAGQFDGHLNIFLRDLALQTNILVSVNTNGLPGNANSTEPAISADGSRVAFTSYASDLVPGIYTNLQNVFVRDWRNGTTTLVSANATGQGGGNSNSYSPAISGDGRFVLFTSQAGNLASGLSGSGPWLFVRDLQANQTHALYPSSVSNASMTPDGHFVAFAASSRGLATEDSIYVWDTLAAARVYTNTFTQGQTTALAISPDGQKIIYALGGTVSQLIAFDRVANTNWVIAPYLLASKPGLRFSADGRWVTYATQGNVGQVFLYDFSTGNLQLISQAFASGVPPNGASDAPDISADGRFIAYHSAASNLVPGDTNDVPDVFIYDRLTGTTTLLTSSRFGPWSASNRSMDPVFSADGRALFFESAASDLIEHDFNNQLDILAYNIISSVDIPVFQVSFAPAGHGMDMTWPVPPGTTTQVQFKNSLTDPEWQDLKTGVTIIGNQGYLRDLGLSGPQRFYRIVARPTLAGR